MSRHLLEICVDTPDGVDLAARAGADRLELCAALDLGGLTPGAGLVAAALRAGVPAHAMIRPRAGDFRLSGADLRACLDDIAAIRATGLAGVVIGAARPDDRLDTAALERMIDAAGPLEVTLHRVVDLTPDPVEAVAVARRLGVRRILTSGGAARVGDGLAVIARMVEAAEGAVQIMAGGGLAAEDIPALLRAGVDALHASCGTAGPVTPGLARLGLPVERRITDPERIAGLRRALDERAAA